MNSLQSLIILFFPLNFPLEHQEREESEKHIRFSKDAQGGIRTHTRQSRTSFRDSPNSGALPD